MCLALTVATLLDIIFFFFAVQPVLLSYFESLGTKLFPISKRVEPLVSIRLCEWRTKEYTAKCENIEKTSPILPWKPVNVGIYFASGIREGGGILTEGKIEIRIQ